LGETRELARSQKVNVTDAGMLIWEPRERRPTVHWLVDVSTEPKLNEAFWCMLFGLLFYLPLAAGLAGSRGESNRFSLAEFGISDEFCTCVRARVRPGTSVLFLLTTDATVDPVIAALHELEFTIASSNLTNSQLEALHAAFLPSQHRLRDPRGHGVA